jgi:hypothetical protein
MLMGLAKGRVGGNLDASEEWMLGTLKKSAGDLGFLRKRCMTLEARNIR